jgi:quercetin dioxygenase-like cupin family protein
MFILLSELENSVQKENIYTAEEKKVNQNYFTGNVIIREVLGQTNSAEQEMYYVTFQSGALTTIHYHESDQILIVTKGKGVVGLIKEDDLTKFRIDDNNIIFLEKEGDTVCIPANRLHFHGAMRGENFSHIAIRKMYKLNNNGANGNDTNIKKADNKWEYDLISEQIRNNDPQAIERITKEIAKKIQNAISQKLENMKTTKL